MCQDGSSSLETCGLRVYDRNTQMETRDPITGHMVTFYFLAETHRPDFSLVVMDGDSGGPMCSKQPDSDAIMHGSVSLQSAYYSGPDPIPTVDCRRSRRYGGPVLECPLMYFTTINAIDALNAHVALQ